MKIVRPRGSTNPSNALRERKFQLKMPRVSTIERMVEQFFLPNYVNKNHGGYFDRLPADLRYLFVKYAYMKGALTEFVKLKNYHEQIQVSTKFRKNFRTNGLEETVVEPADTVYLSDALLEALTVDLTEKPTNFTQFVGWTDYGYMDQNFEVLESKEVPSKQFFNEVVPRLCSRAAVLLYEEHMPDWYEIIRKYRYSIDEFNEQVELLEPLKCLKNQITQDITRASRLVPLTRSTTPNTPNESSEKEEQQTGASSTCRICYANERDCVFMPCKHCVSCTTCAATVVAQGNPCPICRENISHTIDIFLS
jgi:hypothetical protein